MRTSRPTRTISRNPTRTISRKRKRPGLTARQRGEGRRAPALTAQGGPVVLAEHGHLTVATRGSSRPSPARRPVRGCGQAGVEAGPGACQRHRGVAAHGNRPGRVAPAGTPDVAQHLHRSLRGQCHDGRLRDDIARHRDRQYARSGPRRLPGQALRLRTASLRERPGSDQVPLPGRHGQHHGKRHRRRGQPGPHGLRPVERCGLHLAHVVARGCRGQHPGGALPDPLGRRAFAAVVAERRRVNEERLALLPLAQAARQLAEDAERRASFLADASAVLGSSLDYDATLHRMVKLAVPLLADGCSVDLLEDSGTTRRVAQIHIVPAKDEMVRDARARHGFNPSSPSGVPAVLRSRRSSVVSQATEADVTSTARNPEQLTMFRALGLRSWMVVPLTARERVLGAMTFIITESDRRYGHADVSLAEALADRAAAAIDNARLYRDAEAARNEAETANRLKDEFLAMLGHELRNPLGAISNAVHILDRVDDPHGVSATHARQIIARQVQQVGGLIDDLLDVGPALPRRIKLAGGPHALHT